MAITDNTAKWQVKKLTNFTDKSAEIATQAQAEEGVDNTKVMTPLRTKNAIDKQRPLKTYTTLESVGVGNSATIDELASMMPTNSMLVASLQRSDVPNMTLPLDGTLIATKRDNSRVAFQLVCPDGTASQYYFGGYAGWTNPKFSGWKQLATTNDVPAIATQAQAEVGTNNSTVMTPLRVQQATMVYDTYNIGLEQSTMTINTICQSIKDKTNSRNNVCFVGYVEKVQNPNIVFPQGSGSGRLEIYYKTGVFFLTYYPTSATGNTRYIGYLTGSNATFTGWKQLATNGALSMPSNNYVYINKPSFTASIDTEQVITDFYTAPADGWLMLSPYTGNERIHIAEIVVSGKIANNAVWSEDKGARILLPVAKNDSVTMKLTNIYSMDIKFIYAQSEV